MYPFKPYPADGLDYYYRGIVTSFLADYGTPEGEAVPNECEAAYREGQRDGENWAAYGVPLENSCVDLSIESPDALPLLKFVGQAGRINNLPAAMAARSAGATLWESFMTLGAGGASVTSGFATLLGVALSTRDFRWPDESLPADDVVELQQFLIQRGGAAEVELYIGGGVDLAAEGCQLKLTNVFKSEDQVRQAIQAIGRQAWVVGRCRANISGGFEVFDFAE